MSMTMSGTRIENGSIPQDKLLRRYQNLLNLVYLQAQPVKDKGHLIPAKTIELIQTELDFHIPEEKSTKKLEEEIKKRYRQRDSYRFWKESLDLANITNHVDAKDFLMNIFSKLDNGQLYGSMTHSRYALETLQLAIDDAYGTNDLILLQYSQHQPPKKKKTAKKAPKKALKKKAVKVKKTKPPTILPTDDVPF